MASTGIRPGAGDGRRSPLVLKPSQRAPPARLWYPAILFLLLLAIAFAIY